MGRKLFYGKYTSLYILLLCLCLFSCSESTKRSRTGGQVSSTGGGGSGTTTVVNNTTALSVELLHIVDPRDGTFRNKVTIPKNYNGYLYITGVNIVSLSDKLVKVRFKFGREYTSVEIPAVVTTVPGLTPFTQVPALALDMASRPLQNVRMLYDLFDYNNYDFPGGDEPVTDPRHHGLFCRGLYLADDPSYNGSDSICDGANEVCKYAYAKILDKGLVNNTTNVPKFPSEPQIDLGTAGYDSDSNAHKLSKCLPDDGKIEFSTPDLLAYSGGVSGTAVAINGTALINGSTTYKFKGPYLPVNQSAWEISSSAAEGSTGIFLDHFAGGTAITNGIQSLMFPRYTQMDLSANIEHLSGTLPEDSKQINTLPSSGSTEWMDGCNLRVTSYDSFSNENISSCNITASIEVYTTDINTGAENTLTSSKEIKLQLIRDGQYDANNTNISNLPTCSSSATCGSDGCCMNNRCWQRELVGGMCPEERVNTNNFALGDSCTSDFSCMSLCCRGGYCAPHNTGIFPAQYCQKPLGSTCIAKEWCEKVNKQMCLIVTTGPGVHDCALHCYNVQLHGDCQNGTCVDPGTPAVPAFNPSNPDCSTAVPPPLTLP